MASIDELKDDLFEPVHAFDKAIEEQPELMIPMAVVHLIPIALALGGGIMIIRGHQKLRIEKERTKQLSLKLQMHKHHMVATTGGWRQNIAAPMTSLHRSMKRCL